MKKYNTIIFDLDGTLLYTLEDLKNAVNYALSYYGYKERTIEEIRCFVGNGIRKLIERAVPENTGLSDVDKVFEQFKIYYNEHATDKTIIYKGVEDILYILKEKGYNLGIVSNKVQSAVDILHERFFKDIIEISVGDKEGSRRKPAPDSVIEVMRYFDTTSLETLYIGDSEIDIETARNAQIDCISVSWGFRDAVDLMKSGATTIVTTPEELLEKIL
ncbi:MAG: HAD family hydrolase [Lachnospiraceae bacterium]|nr:HAD family hydrolase [Lachnospiraceae bacterium]